MPLQFERMVGVAGAQSPQSIKELDSQTRKSRLIDFQGVSPHLSNRDGPPQNEAAAPAGYRNGDKLAPRYSQAQKYPEAAPDATIVWLRRELIAECGDSIASLGMSLAEAAWRGSDATAEVTLRQIIAATRTACATFREIRPASIEGGAR